MVRILIMTDSTCDLPTDWVRRLDIRVVPTYVHFGTESLADDGVQLTRPEFYQRLFSGPVMPTTSAPAPGEVQAVLEKALQDADHVVALTAPAVLSALYNTFRIAVENTDPARVTLIDSGMVSMGMGWQAVIAAEMAQRGASVDEVKDAVASVRARVDLWAALDTLEYVRRSGRVSWAAAAVGNLFHIRPIIRLLNGEISAVTRVRTSQRAFQTLVDLVHEAAPLDRLAVLHTNYPSGVRQLVEALSDIRPPSELVIVDVTPVLGVHVGPNGLGVSVVRKLV